MELRGQDKEIGMPNSLGYNPPNNRESSSKVSAAPRRAQQQQTVPANTIFNNPSQALDHHLPLYHHQLNSQQQHIHHKHRRDPDSDSESDPDPDPVPTPIAATTSTTITPIASGSTFRSSQPVPVPTSTTTATTTTTTTISAAPLVRYTECLKNHAASMGGHVVDGCGEFMPSGEDGTLEALKCAACECHRNFHRKEIDGESQYVTNCYYPYNNPIKTNNQRNTISTPTQVIPTSLPLQQPPLYQHHKYPHGLSTCPSGAPIAPMMMAFAGGSGGGVAESSSEDLNMFQSNEGGQTSVEPMLSKKRFRTKFSQEQKDKMMELADKLGWKIQKQDEQEVQQFCSQVGVKRQVFKVWMHNNKAMKKKQM